MITKGQKINDRYEIVKSIGEGGMANVYLAVDLILNRKVAIKILRGDLANDEKFIRRFQREALAASSLSHPNIVEMYDVGEDNGNYYIVMEYIEGKTLKQLLKKRGHLTVGEAVDIMLQITDGMVHAHDSYIIHRDLKPQNIMIQEDGQIKITDFGIAMALNSTQLTQTNSVMGSVHYLPPEQASGKGSAIPSVRKQNPNIPQSVENIIIRATAKNPKNRYNDTREMYNDLKTCLDKDRQNVDRIVFKYPEHENEDTKKIPVIKKDEPKKEEKVDIEKTGDIVKEVPMDEGKTAKRIILILIGVLVAVFVIGGTILMLTAGREIPNVKVPDVSGMTVVDAEQVLTDAGFVVKTQTEKVADENYDEGKVVKTEPEKGRLIKKGKTIIIYESTGKETYVIEDYTGKNYIEIETLLKNMYKLDVKVEKKEVEIKDDTDTQAIIDQSLKAGTKVKEGDKITLYIPDAYEKYPDFVNEEWTVEDIKAFCEKYNLKLTIAYSKTDVYKEGKIIYQSRAAKSEIVKGASLKITIAKPLDSSDTPDDEGKPAEEEQNP